MRSLSSAALAALQRSPLPIAALVEMWLPGAPLCLNTGGIDLQVTTPSDMLAYYAALGISLASTVPFYGARGLGSIAAVRETGAEIAPMQFELSAVTSELIAVALGTAVQGKTGRIKFAIFDPDTYQVLDIRLRWAGVLDVMSIDDDTSQPKIQVTAEHGAMDLLRASNVLYSDADQRALHSGDPSLQYMADQVDMHIIWPASTWGRK